MRPFTGAADYDQVSRFLIDVYEPADRFANWLQPRWEYMFSHPLVDDVDLTTIGIYEEAGDIVGLVHPEHSMSAAYFQVRPGRDDVKPALFDWFEEHIGGSAYINEFDVALTAEARRRGYHVKDEPERHSLYRVDGDLAVPPVPEGFRLADLAEDNDLAKIHRVLWRGFGHEGEPPPSGIPDRERMQRTPGFRKELTAVAVAPNGDFAAFGGMWYVPENNVAYVEPVATDPDYRRLGLGSAVVLETVRRVAALGAHRVWVGSDQQFYLQMGFRVMFESTLWEPDA